MYKYIYIYNIYIYIYICLPLILLIVCLILSYLQEITFKTIALRNLLWLFIL